MDFDVVIVGGGLAGLALAVALKKTRLSVALIEDDDAPTVSQHWDSRIYALTPANKNFLTEIGVWGHLDASRICPVQEMAIFGEGDGYLGFSAYEAGVDELAWILEASSMRLELWENIKRQGNLTLFCPAAPQSLHIDQSGAIIGLVDGRQLVARLVVAADGANSWTRSAAGIDADFNDYEQYGVVANFVGEYGHRNTACQWFLEGDVVAFLPLPENRLSIVWATSRSNADRLLALAPDQFCMEVAAAGKNRFGGLMLETSPVVFPLRLMRVPRLAMPRFALIGDSAHAIHPLSGHGINLGFGDAQCLAETLAACPEHIDCGDLSWLRRFDRARKEQILALQSITHGLQRLFAQSNPLLAILRNHGLSITHRMPFVKNLLVRYAIG